MRVYASNPYLIGHATISQVREEFIEFLKHIEGCKSALEIGSLYGGSASRIGQALTPGGRLVSIDLGMEPLKKDWVTLPTLLHRLSAIPDRDVHLLIGNSTSSDIIEEARKLGPYDLVFIDGGHTEDAVQSDWNNYGPMGKIVAFHDINSCDGVKAVWKRVRNAHAKHVEIIHGPEAGTGIVWR